MHNKEYSTPSVYFSTGSCMWGLKENGKNIIRNNTFDGFLRQFPQELACHIVQI